MILLCVNYDFWGWYFMLYSGCLNDAGLSELLFYKSMEDDEMFFSQG